MPANYTLLIQAEQNSATLCLSLYSAKGKFLASHAVNLASFSSSEQRSLFDLRNYLRHYVLPAQQQTALAAVGVCIAQRVLGKEIVDALWQSSAPHNLRIVLPTITATRVPFAVALLRLPWEFARPALSQPSLAERKLRISFALEASKVLASPVNSKLVALDEPLRILFVCAENHAAQALGLRKERQAFMQLFASEISPRYQVQVDFLSHDVSYPRLIAQIEQSKGYHIIHWSGHGQANALQLNGPSGSVDTLSAQDLLTMFRLANCALPALFFLSACDSGNLVQFGNWQEFVNAVQHTHPNNTDLNQISISSQNDAPHEVSGFVYPLLEGGVATVVAMRDAVSDDYARELSLLFYRALLVRGQSIQVALATARAKLALSSSGRASHHFTLADHATPVLFGNAQLRVALQSPAQREAVGNSHLFAPQIAELNAHHHTAFIGRTREIKLLGKACLSFSSKNPAIGLITGLPGMGKTALVAELLALWQSHFCSVLLYQAKPVALEFDATLLDIHLQLSQQVQDYRLHIQANPHEAIFRPAEAQFQGAERLQCLCHNLAKAMRANPMLLVLDNFEVNLSIEPVDLAFATAWACKDAAWDICLTVLAQQLRGSASGVLITSRRPLACLLPATQQDSRPELCHLLPLGPLSAQEAALYLREHPVLCQMLTPPDLAERDLALRLINASQFHPLLMESLARLAKRKKLRPRLLAALELLENRHGFAQLPSLFATQSENPVTGQASMRYLDDALDASIAQLLGFASKDALRLLWLVSLANGEISIALLEAVWLACHRPAGKQMTPILRQLASLGLLSMINSNMLLARDSTRNLIACHQLVVEQIRAYMASNASSRADLTENRMQLAYAEVWSERFAMLKRSNLAQALLAGRMAMVYCVQAGNHAKLTEFASTIINSTSDAKVLQNLLPHLQSAAASAPEGRWRWSCLCLLADALSHAGQDGASLAFYREAQRLARASYQGGEDTQAALTDLAWIHGNAALAYMHTGQYDEARQQIAASIAAKQQVGRPLLDIVSSETVAMRIDLIEGKVAQALAAVAPRLQQLQTWWQMDQAGETVSDAPNTILLERVLLAALDIARDGEVLSKNWQSALLHLNQMLEIKQQRHHPSNEIARTKINRANVLRHLGQFHAAQDDLESCLQAFSDDPIRTAKVRSSLASLFANQDEITAAIEQERRALALRENLPDPVERAISHNNLAVFLDRLGTPTSIAEMRWHQFAALVYRLVIRMGQGLQTSRKNYAKHYRRAWDAKQELLVPTLAQILARSDFYPLLQWLGGRELDLTVLQQDIDNFLQQAQQLAQEITL